MEVGFGMVFKGLDIVWNFIIAELYKLKLCLATTHVNVEQYFHYNLLPRCNIVVHSCTKLVIIYFFSLPIDVNTGLLQLIFPF